LTEKFAASERGKEGNSKDKDVNNFQDRTMLTIQDRKALDDFE